MYPHVVYNSATPTGLGHVSTCRLQFFNPYGVGLVWCRSSTILQPLRGWAGLVPIIYNSATPTGLGWFGANHLQFCNPYRVGSGWFPFQRLMPSPNTTAYCLLPTTYCLLPTACCLLPTAYCLLPTATAYCYCLLPTAYCLMPILTIFAPNNSDHDNQ